MFPLCQVSSCLGSFWGKLAFMGKSVLGRFSVFLSSSGSAIAWNVRYPFLACVAVRKSRCTAGNIERQSNLVCYNEAQIGVSRWGAQPFLPYGNPIPEGYQRRGESVYN